MPGLVVALILSRMYCTDLLSIFCRVWKSSDCRAKENECNDSEGNRCRSSIAGDAGPLARLCSEADRDVELDMGNVCVCLIDCGEKVESSSWKVEERDS